MTHYPSAAAARHGLAVLAVAAALGLTRLLSPLEPSPAPLFLAAVLAGAWTGGPGPGFLAAALSALALAVCFPPADSPAADAFNFLVFLAVAVAACACGAAGRAHAEARRRLSHESAALAVAAHELRNFLGTVLVSLDLVRSPESDNEAREKAWRVAERQLHHMARLADDWIDLARLDQGKVRLRREALDLCQVAGQAAAAVAPLAEARGLRLLVALPPEPLLLVADPTRLEQILFNLLTNAVRHTGAGGLIRLAVERRGDAATVRVRDTGAGIPADRLARVFDLFVQGDEAHEGLGVGLSLVRSLVRLHGGDVVAASAGPGRGAEFLIRLPLRRADPPSPPKQTARAATSAKP